MKKAFTSVLSILAIAALSSCGSADQMAKQAEGVAVNCDPSPLMLRGGKVEATVAVKYPKGYFNSKAVLEVTPVIVYEGGEQKMEPLKYQGEKVLNNYKVVPSEGGIVTEKLRFPFVEGMEKCRLELRGKCTVNNGKKWVVLPVRKVADGCNITENLANVKGVYSLKDHEYQAIINLAPEGQVMYQVNSSAVKTTELTTRSVRGFREALVEVDNDDRQSLKNIEVVAYASPEGPEAKNTQLSNDRSKSAKKAFDQVIKEDKSISDKNIKADVRSIGEDWEGFKEMVQGSRIEDKDLILRVLSMYSDSKVREQEIRNMASIYQDLAKDVLPQLRRARFIANIEYRNYSDEEIQELLKENARALDESALLKAATLTDNLSEKKDIYRKAIDRFNSERAKFNLVCLALDEDNLEAAKVGLAQCNQEDADVKNLKGVIALRKGEITDAKSLFEAAGTKDANQNLGYCAIMEGELKTALNLCGDKGLNAAVANLLGNNPEAAMNCVKDCNCPKSDYIRAICLNRLGKVSDAREMLKKATDADKSLAKRAETDIEFANLK